MFSLSDEQASAARAVRDWYRERERQPFCLAGYAGSGKSTIIPYIIDELGLNPAVDVAYLAPTGKAARVMTRKLDAAGVRARATTIHKAIYHSPTDLGHPDKEELTEDERIALRLAGRANLHFERNKKANIREARLIVCDEASMVSEREAGNMREFGVPILSIGDPGQLPPVDSKQGFDMGMADFFLTEIHRQALDNPIIRLAHEVRQGKYPQRGTYGDAVRIVPPNSVEIPHEAAAMPTVITGTHKKRWDVTAKIRDALGFEGPLPLRGERVICCKNSRPLPDLVNGAEATMVSDAFIDKYDTFAVIMDCVDDDGAPIYTAKEDWDGSIDDRAPIQAYRGLFDEHVARRRGAVEGPKRLAVHKQQELEWFDFGWVITCHKSQGSQWDDVLVLDESYIFRNEWRRWLYTAITRAAKTLTIVTD